MRLILHNFKQWAKIDLEFPDHGSVLIRGKSGIGKSSILNAIYFALYGSGNKVVKFGCSSCSVDLYFKDIHIFRKKLSDKLIVTIQKSNEAPAKTFEDEVGQEVINLRIGSQNYTTTSYIQQKLSKSFLSLPQSEKFIFVQQLFCDLPIIQNLKSNLKTENSKLLTDSTKTDVESKILKSQNESLTSNIKKEKISRLMTLSASNKQADNNHNEKYVNLCTDEIVKQIQFTEISIKNSQTKLQKLDLQIEQMQQLTNELKSLELQLNNLEKNILVHQTNHSQLQSKLSDILQKIQNFEENASGNDAQALSTDIDNLKNFIQTLETQIGVENISKNLKTLNSEQNTIQKSIQAIKLINSGDIDKIIQNKTKSEHLKSQIENCTTNVIQIEDKLKNLQNIDHGTCEKLEKQISVYNQTIIRCPNCLKYLKKKTDDTNIEINPYEIAQNQENACSKVCKTEIANLENQLKRLRESLLTKTQMENEMKYEKAKLNKYQAEMDMFVFDRTDQQKLENHQQSLAKQTELQSKLDKIKEKAKTISETCELDQKKLKYINYINSEEYKRCKTLLFANDIEVVWDQVCLSKSRSLLDNISIDQRNHVENTEKRKRCLEIKNEVEKQIKTIKNKIESEKLIMEDLQEKIQDSKTYNSKNLHDSKDVLLQTVIQNKDELIQLNSYLKICELCDQITHNNNELKQLENKKHEIDIFLNWNDRLNKAIDVSQAMILSETIDHMNMELNTILEDFFPDDPMIVNLDVFKEVKKNIKTQINLKIFYKNESTDVQNLSGGESDRLQLAFYVLLNKMQTTPLLMLDESLSSLDDSQANSIISKISKHARNKLVIIVSHQTIEGQFYNIVDLDNR